MSATLPVGPIATVRNGGNLGAAYTLPMSADVWLKGALNANCTITLSGLAGAQRATLLLTQDATGSRTLTISDGVNSQVVAITATPNSISVVTLETPDGSTVYITSPSGTTGATGPSGASNGYSPSMNNLLAATFPTDRQPNGAPLGNGFGMFTKVYLPTQVTIANFLMYVSTAGTSLTASQNKCGVYKSDGTLVARTADQSGSWTSTGMKTMALTAEAGQSLQQGGDGVSLYLVALTNGTGTRPSVYQSNSAQGVLANVGLADPNLRCGFFGGGVLTDLPATMTTQTTGNEYWWFGLS